MANATIVRAWQANNTANIAVVVTEVNGDRVEYLASVPIASLGGTNAQKKAQLVAAVKAVRDAAIVVADVDLSAMANGVVTI